MKELALDNADGLISFGSTGAVLVSGLLIAGGLMGLKGRLLL